MKAIWVWKGDFREVCFKISNKIEKWKGKHKRKKRQKTRMFSHIKLQEAGPFCLLQNRNQNQTKKRKVSKHLLACWNTTHYFCKTFFLQLTPCSQQKLCFVENTIEIVLWAEHSFNGNALLSTFQTQIVFCNFLNMPIFTIIFPTQSQNTYSWACLNVPFDLSSFLFVFLQHQKGKTKNACFVSKPSLLTSRQFCGKKNTILSRLHTICDFLKNQKHIKN